MKKTNIVISILLMIIGMGIFLYPYATHRYYCAAVDNQKHIFVKEKQSDNLEKLYKELKRRNEKLFYEQQNNFVDVLSCQESPIDLKKYGLKSNIIGFLSIPKMKIKLPILLGATQENMKLGAAHLTGTSYPIGGNNTNCVLAAHRGYSKTAMFRDIEKLKIKDKIYIENFRERLIYEVIECRVIQPTDVDELLIREGQDLVTLITCHPYRHNNQRYVVFCKKV